MVRKTALPKDFRVDDHMRSWSFDKGWPSHLPDVFVRDFVNHHEAKGTRLLDWRKAFTNWISWASPSGRFYNTAEWERKLEQAKAMDDRGMGEAWQAFQGKAKPLEMPEKIKSPPSEEFNRLREELRRRAARS